MLGKDYDYTQERLDDYANQNNPNNEEYWHSRGLDYQNPDLEDWEISHVFFATKKKFDLLFSHWKFAHRIRHG